MGKPTEGRRGSIAYQPALDGLRGLALVGMLCFHAEFSWAVGGFLPIPTFFTLSGYLITYLFLKERETSGTIRLGAFWSRRLRRLMPAALLTLAGMSLFGAFVATPEQLSRLRGDVFWALAYLANWRFLLSDVAYAQLFEAPSPVQHFWSLAIEEQFYLLFPFVTFVGMHVGGGSRRALALVYGLLALASVLTSVWLSAAGAPVDRIYYGTDTRGAELLLGGLLALALYGRTIRTPAARRAIDLVGAGSLVGMVWLWTHVDLDASWLYNGGFAAYSLLSVAVIAAGVQPSGIVRRVLSGSVIRWIGRVSYGAYLFHWPIYLWLSPERTGLEQWPLFFLRVTVTFGLAELSYRFLETPIRTRRAIVGWRPFVATPAAFASVALAATAVTAGASDDAGLASSARQLDEQLAVRDEESGRASTSSERAAPRVAFYGDSTAVRLAVAFDNWSRTQQGPPMPAVRGVAELGCGLMRQGAMRYQGRVVHRPQKCKLREESWARLLDRRQPDLVVVSYGPWEVPDRKLPKTKRWSALGDESIDEQFRREARGALELLARNGTLVVWLTHPVISTQTRGTRRPPAEPFPESDPARMARMNELIREAAARHPENVRVLDLRAYMQGLPGGEMDTGYRSDGVHLNPVGSARVVEDWLAAELLRLYREKLSETDG